MGMNSRSIITLAIAVVIGLGAMKLSQQLLSGKPKEGDDSQEVLVAARDFKEEEILKPDMVKLNRIARSAIPPNAFGTFKEVEDRWVRTTMLEGDVLVEKKLGAKGTPPGLVANIPKGMRALAIDVTEQSGVSGFILPGHHVDVVRHVDVVKPDGSSEKTGTRGETILQDVLVLAAGQIFTRPDERAVQSRTVTLALPPGDVDILVAARARGALSLSLRGVNDHEKIAVQKAEPKVDTEAEKRWKLAEEARQKLEADLAALKEELARKPAEQPRVIPPRPLPRIATVYRGLHNMQQVRLDLAGVSELSTAELTVNPDTGFPGLQKGSRSGSFGSPEDETQP
jgi:pilus assembly protein CpaB